MSAKAVDGKWGWRQMEELLQCPVCYDLPIGPVLQCGQGHHFCSPCRDKLPECPLCKSKFTGTRNYVMEELLANIPAIKKNMTNTPNMSNGSPTSASSSGSTDNVSEEQKREKGSGKVPTQCRGSFPCLLCNQKFPVSRVLNHIRYIHPERLTEVTSDGEFYSQVWEIDYELNNTYVNAIKIERMGVYFLTIKILATGEIQIFVQMIAAHQIAQQYTYSIRINVVKENMNQLSRVFSTREPQEQIVRRAKCLILDADKLTCLRSSNAPKQITCHLTIRHAGPLENTRRRRQRQRPAPIESLDDVYLDDIFDDFEEMYLY